jgi:outer membrane receptor for ferrienterochelin and colicin
VFVHRQKTAWLTGLLISFLVMSPVLADDPDEPADDELVDSFDELDLADEFAFLEDAEMVESAARHRQEIGMSPSAVTVLTRDDVEASGATNLPDLLRLVPGMDVVIVSPAYASVSSRTQWTNTNNHYQVLIDGRDANHELLGQTPWHIESISLDDIERIEILRGPASSLYGASAFAGVISITTRILPEKTSGVINLVGGETGLMEAGMRGSTRIGDFGFSVSGEVGQVGYWSDPHLRARNIWKLRSVIEYRFSDSEYLKLDFSMNDAAGAMNTSSGLVDIDFVHRTLRLAYESKAIRSRLYWYQSPAHFTFEAPLDFNGIQLATFVPVTVDAHCVDGEVQWTLPEFYEPLLIITGGSVRASYLGSDQLLDGDSYADISSDRYHQPGISYWEGRASVFAHAEYVPTDWVTITGSLRFDYNTQTEEFISPRLVSVFKPAKGQYLRIGAGRAFLKPAFIDTQLHPMAEFPTGSPITDHDSFQEFLSRSIGNPDLKNVELLSFEVGYLGLYLDGKLSVALDVYYNQLRDLFTMHSEITTGPQGLPDLNASVFQTRNNENIDIHGFELVVRVNPTDWLWLMASWAHRQVLSLESGHIVDTTPKNLLTLGGRFRFTNGIIGSCYFFSRSEFFEEGVENPEGMLETRSRVKLDNYFLILAKLGYKFTTGMGFDLEAGAKLFLPVSPFSGPLFKYYEDAGGISPKGVHYGGEQIGRTVTFYLQGTL